MHIWHIFENNESYQTNVKLILEKVMKKTYLIYRYYGLLLFRDMSEDICKNVVLTVL